MISENIVATPSDTLPKNLTLHRYKRTNKSYSEDLGGGVRLTLMQIPAGEFVMGAPEDEPGSEDNERPQHRVKVAQFYMGRFPVTQAQWRSVARYERVDRDLALVPSKFKGDDCPVECVSWEEAQEFCQRLSASTKRDYIVKCLGCTARTLTTGKFICTMRVEIVSSLQPSEDNNE
jgi:formylglycine-generating enzyme required for sulfatase activity